MNTHDMTGIKRAVMAGLSFLIPAVVVFFLFKAVDIDALKRCFTGIDYRVLGIIALLEIMVRFVIPSYKLMMTFRYMGIPLVMKDSLHMHLGGYPVESVTPLKSGAVIKLLYMSSRYGVPVSISFSAFIFEKFVNLGCLLLFVIVFSPGAADFPVQWFAIIFVITMLILFGLKYPLEQIESAKVNPEKRIYAKLREAAAGLTRSFRAIPLHGKLLLFLYGLILQAVSVYSVALSLSLFGVEAPLLRVFSHAPLIMLTTKIPFFVSGIGIREVSTFVLFSAFGTKEELLSAGILMTFVQSLLMGLIGTFFLRSLIRKTGLPGTYSQAPGKTTDEETRE